MAREQGRKVVAQNKKARHDYLIEDVFEAGLVLQGTEVKSLRQGRASLVDGYAFIDGGEAWLRVYVREAPRAGLREEVQEMLPRALEVRIDPTMLPESATTRPSARAAGRSAGDLFTEYLAGKGHDDPATRDLFHRLHGEVS